MTELRDEAGASFDLLPGRTPKASEHLASEIRRRVLSRGMQTGETLPSESELITQTGLSRATVREALRLLESEGMIEVKRGPRGGVTVGKPSSENVARSLALLLTVGEASWRELFAFREFVEPAAAAGAAENATDEQRRELLALAKSEAGDARIAHHTFHVLLAQASGNQLFSVILVAIEQAVHWLSADADLSEWDMAGANAAHKAIAEAISRGDARKAERLMRSHLEAFEAACEEAGMLDSPLLPRARWSDRTSGRFGAP